VFERTAPPEPTSIQALVGHWTDHIALTGCTVVLFDRPAPAVVDVRGGAPGTRETDLLAPGKLVRSVDAILLTGGSAFGLAAADGVMRYLQEQGRGVATPAGPIPIVPAAVIFDLAVGLPTSPNADAGYQACLATRPIEELQRGRIGAGIGATTGKLLGNSPRRGGFGVSTVTWSAGSVSALVVVNAAGDVVDPAEGEPDRREQILAGVPALGERQATTLGVILVNVHTDETTLTRCAVSAHDAFARAIRPCHTIFDGDLVFAVGLIQGTPSPVEVVGVTTATELAMERAVIDAVTA
jgi:L-aminopeptidase/D-esterase-like protein